MTSHDWARLILATNCVLVIGLALDTVRLNMLRKQAELTLFLVTLQRGPRTTKEIAKLSEVMNEYDVRLALSKAIKRALVERLTTGELQLTTLGQTELTMRMNRFVEREK